MILDRKPQLIVELTKKLNQILKIKIRLLTVLYL